MRVKVPLVVLFLLVSVGCAPQNSVAPGAGRAAATEPAPSPSNVHRALVANWNRPRDWVQVSSFEELRQKLTVFAPYEPKTLLDAMIYMDPSATPEGVILVYNDETYGRLWIVEELPSFGGGDEERLAGYEAIVATNGQPDRTSTSEIANIRGSNFGLLNSSDDSVTTPTNIEWVENGVLLQILGETATTEQILDLANSI